MRQFTWKRFFIYAVVGVFSAVVNCLLVGAARLYEPWGLYYIPVGLAFMLAGPIVGVGYICFHNLGKGAWYQRHDATDCLHFERGDPTPGRGGFATGFAFTNIVFVGSAVAEVVMKL